MVGKALHSKGVFLSHIEIPGLLAEEWGAWNLPAESEMLWVAQDLAIRGTGNTALGSVSHAQTQRSV